VLVTLTSEQTKLQHALASATLEGHAACNLPSALQVAQLVLKNRQNSNQRQRIIAFLGSPLPADNSSFSTIGKLLKKNGVSLDIVSFGNEKANAPAVAQLLSAAAGVEANETNIHEALLAPGCECHLLQVSVGDNLTESLMTSPILLGEDGVPGGGYGMDMDMDPELAMALKLSLEEEKSRMEREKPGENQDPATEMVVDDDDEEVMLQKAIAMSMETATQETKDQKQQ
jgi:26S proteasome regulatory subunit N10